MRRFAPSFVLLALALGPGCVSSGEVGKDSTGGGGGGGVFPTEPTFQSARASPGPGEIYVAAQLVDPTTMRLHLEMEYPDGWDTPFEFRIRLGVPGRAVEPVSATAGSTWPDADPDVSLDRTSDPDRFEVKVDLDDWKGWSCYFGPPWSRPGNRIMRFATVTVKLREAGQHPVELGPTDWKSGRILAECSGERTPAAYGGVIVIP